MRLAMIAMTVAFLAALLAPARPAPAATATAPAADEPRVVVVFDFGSPDGGKAGRAFAESLRLRARRLGLVTVERLSLKEALAGRPSPTPDTPAAQMATVLKDNFGATLGLWGDVRTQGEALVMNVRGMNLETSADKLAVNETFTAAQPQLVNPVQDEILAALSGKRKKPLPEATPEADARVPTKGPELVPNGGFETGDKTPDSWQRIDGQTTFWPAPGETGRGLKINTDVYHDEWVKWQEKVRAGASADQAPAPTPTQGAKYDTVAGIYGVAYDSKPIPVTPGKAYKVGISYRGNSTDFFFPKLFIRGWADVKGEKRVVYDAYLALRCMEGDGQWKSNVRIVEIPADGPKIEYLVLKIYAYWPPGAYHFDNVSLKEVDR